VDLVLFGVLFYKGFNVGMYDFSSENVGSLGTKDFLNIMIGVENRVKIFREKTQENLGMKTWIP
jgi:hypothetical protein